MKHLILTPTLYRHIQLCLFLCVALWQSTAEAIDIDTYGRCDYSDEEWADPDKLIELKLFSMRNCSHSLFSGDGLPALKEQHHPPKFIEQQKKLSNRYYPEDRDFDPPSSGSYREYKILKKEPHLPIDGKYQSYKYTIELLYTLGGVGDRIPNSIFGQIAICERDIIEIYMVNIEGRWYFYTSSTDIGTSVYIGWHNLNQQSLYLSPKGKPKPELFQKYLTLINQCKDTLN